MIGGLSYGELGFVAVLLALVLLSQVAPRIGESIGALFDGAASGPKPRAGEASPFVEGKPASKDGPSPHA